MASVRSAGVRIVSRTLQRLEQPNPTFLDFLYPQLNIKTNSPRFLYPSSRPRHFSGIPLQQRQKKISRSLEQRRNISTSLPRQKTLCVQNPQTDDDGKEMMLELTPRAAKKLTDIMRRDNNPDLSLRIEVQSGGCHGFQYLMSLQSHPDSSTTNAEDNSDVQDVVFRYFEDDAEPDLNSKAPTLILDEASLELLKGSKVDFTSELIGSQFKIVDNPYATSSCGCGTSFDIKP